jgi:hypothetical protein
MSNSAASGIARIPAWLRYGLIAGTIAFACTLAANLAITWLSPADLCRMGPVLVGLLSLGALIIFVAMAAAAGFKTARSGTPAPDPTLAGLLVGVLGGCALVVLLALVPSVEHRFQELSTACPALGSVSGGGSFSFNFGPTLPPGYVIPTPPPGLFPTPPPGGFATPPPGAFAFPPPGPTGTLGLVFQMLITILIGVAGATGAATVAGLAGTAARSRALQKGPS